MLGVDEPQGLAPLPPVLPKGVLDNVLEKPTAGPRLESASAISLTARDTFVAETATKIEQLQASVRLLTRELNQVAGRVAELQEIAAQEHRWYAFQRGEKQARADKLDVLGRCCRDLKARLDKIESRSGGDYHAYNSFEAVSRKLAEIERWREEARRPRPGPSLRHWLFGVTLLAAASIFGLSVLATNGLL